MNLSPCTYGGYNVNIEKHIIPAIGNIQLQKLQPLHIQNFYNDLYNKTEDKLSVSSIRYIHATLRKALNDAVKMQYVPRNVTEVVTVPKKKQKEAKFLNKEQIGNLLKAVKDTNIYLPTMLAIYLGLRRGEVLGLKWEDLDFEKGLISIKRSYTPNPHKGCVFSDTKTDKSRRILAVPTTIIQYLKKHKNEQALNKLFLGGGYKDLDLICCNEDGSPLSPYTWQSKFKKLLKDNDLPDIRIHDLRHTDASLMLK